MGLQPEKERKLEITGVLFPAKNLMSRRKIVLTLLIKF
jgi:hypothetical protein